MRIVRFYLPDLNRPGSGRLPHRDAGEHPGTHWGVIEEKWVRRLTGPPFPEVLRDETRYPLSEVHLLAPVVPSKVVAVGYNYIGHIEEMGHERPLEPLIFLKAPSAVIGHGEAILIPKESSNVHYEGELAIVIGSRCRRVSPEEASQFILGYTILNDVTARDLQRVDGQFARSKGFDTFCPVGPWIETELDPTSVRITTVVNSELRQEDNTSTMLFDAFYLVSHISAAMTLEPGDVIATGTPSGVGSVQDGDQVSVAIEGIGVLTNPVGLESP
jgi:2-keto-4-pentenoate hydratase/2-oxohepta-3-ene-1,7-dioic acid hydratase in catechol pathway